MSIPLSFFLVIYLILVGLFLLYAVFNLYHIFRHGHFDTASYFMTGLFIAGTILILFISAVYLFGIDFSQGLELFNINPSNIPTTQF